MSGDFYFGGERWAKGDFLSAARRIAQDMTERGVGTDDVVGVLLYNDPNFLAIVEACRYVGARYVNINWHSAPQEVQYILEDSRSKLIYAHSSLLAPIMEFLPASVSAICVPVAKPIAEDYDIIDQAVPGSADFAQILNTAGEYTQKPLKMRGMFAYTSGSTGKPKGIKRAFDPDGPDSWETYAGFSRGLMGVQPGDRLYIAAPMYHSAPNAISVFVMAAGDCDIYIDAKFDPERFLATIDQHKITHAYIVPTMMVRLLKLPQAIKDKYDVSSLKFAVSTGSPCPVDIKAQIIDWFGPILFETYGASEIGFITMISSQEALEKPGSVGKILPGGTIKVLDDDFNELGVGEVGTLYIHLPLFGDYEYTNADGAMAGQRQGVFSTVGDIGHIDADGYLYISDRKKDMIISGGANIFPAEIEAQLILMPEVADCAVFGAPDAEFGETIVAAVTCQPGQTVTIDTVQAFLEPRLAKFKLPRIVDVHDALPRQDTGKIYKAKLRAPYWDQAGRQV